jgi:hypothetical protein
MAKKEVVSKAELDASEYTNLRDYLNAKRGLTRKGGGAPEYKPGRAPAAPFSSEPKDYTVASAGMQSPDMASAMRKGYADVEPQKEDKPKEEMPFAERYLGRPSKEERAAMRERAPKFIQKALDAVGLKKGGSVSSASSRADGCAQRGKTKGRVV